jgi:hypothetical protein
MRVDSGQSLPVIQVFDMTDSAPLPGTLHIAATQIHAQNEIRDGRHETCEVRDERDSDSMDSLVTIKRKHGFTIDWNG